MTDFTNNNDPKNGSRRKAVKTIVSGVGAFTAYHVLPSDWTKPIVEQVFFPAHAATSGTSLVDPCSITLLSGTQLSVIVTIRVSGFLAPPIAGLPVQINANPIGPGSTVTANTTTNEQGDFSADITLNGPGVTSVAVTTVVTGATGAASCSVNVPLGSTSTPPPSSTPPIT